MQMITNATQNRMLERSFHRVSDLSTRNADKGGGTGHRNASAAGEEGFLAIKCSEDSCVTDGNGKEKLKVFSGTKEPLMVVPVKPVKPEDS